MSDKQMISGQSNLRIDLDEKESGVFGARSLESMSHDEVRRALHELQVHQIELEMQNEQLRQTRAELENSRARYFELYDLAPVGYFTTNEEGVLTEVNLTAASMLGLTKKDMLKVLFSRFILPGDLGIYYKNRRQLFEIGDKQVYELRLLRKETDPFWARIEATLVTDAVGMPTCRAVLSDITEHKLAEETLKKSMSLYNDLVETSQDLIFQCDASGRYTYLNPAWETVFGYKIEEMLGKKYYEFQTHEMAELNQSEFDHFIQGEYPIKGYETVHVGKSGNPIHLVFNAKFLTDEYGEIIGVRGSAYDNTDRKQMEENNEKLLAQNWQLQKTKSLGVMAGGIAHHFNNQLFAVTGNLYLALDNNGLDSDTIDKLTNARLAAEKAAEISGLMLTYLGQTSGKYDPIDLSDLCRKHMLLLRSAIPKNIGFEAKFQPSGIFIKGDANQIQMALGNLIINAYESLSNSHDSIALSVSTVNLSEIPDALRFPRDWQPQGEFFACMEVSDSGCGIAEADMEKLFDPFFTTRFTGRGLGLSVVLGIVNAHGGLITVESVLNKESKFRLFFPLLYDENIEQFEKAAQLSEFEDGGTVLLVDDNNSVLQTSKAILERSLGFRVITANDGIEAVEAFRQHMDEIRFVVCDLTMPRMDGWETLTALRKLSPGIPVILSSGYDKAHVMAGEHPELPQSFLGKPYKPRELRNAIAEALMQVKPPLD